MNEQLFENAHDVLQELVFRCLLLARANVSLGPEERCTHPPKLLEPYRDTLARCGRRCPSDRF